MNNQFPFPPLPWWLSAAYELLHEDQLHPQPTLWTRKLKLHRKLNPKGFSNTKNNKKQEKNE